MGIFHTHVVLPLSEPERYSGLPGRLRQIGKFERMSEKQQQKIQLDRLRALLEHAYTTVPYYRKQFDDAGFHPRQARIDRPLSLPVLTREHLRASEAWLISTACPPEKLRVTASSGNTWVPIRFYRDIEGIRDKVALKIKLDEWSGIKPGDSSMMLWGTGSSAKRESNWKWRMDEGVFMRQTPPPPGTIAPQDLERWQFRYEKQRPTVLAGRATVLAAFAAYLMEHGVRHRPHAVIATAEVLSPLHRQLLASAFKSEPFNQYGRRDVGMIAAECSEHEGLHFHPWGSYVEFDPVGNSPDGIVYRLLVTDLLNYGQPFIRYDTGDCVTLTDQTCSCGRWFPLAGRIVGRIADGFVRANGAVVPGIALTNSPTPMPRPFLPILPIKGARKRPANAPRRKNWAMSA